MKQIDCQVCNLLIAINCMNPDKIKFNITYFSQLAKDDKCTFISHSNSIHLEKLSNQS